MIRNPKSSAGGNAFTLAELLIALALLGVIATFTIPKVLESSQDGKYNAIAKETAGMISGGFANYKINNTVTSGTLATDVTQFMNYVALDTTSLLDGAYGSGSVDCSVNTCLKLHSGGTLLAPAGISFGGTAATNAVYYYFDPDGSYSGSATGNGKSVALFVYFNGRLTTYSNLPTGTTSSFGAEAVCASCDPPWFSWNQ